MWHILDFVKTSICAHHENVTAKYGAEESIPAHAKSVALDTFPLKVLEGNSPEPNLGFTNPSWKQSATSAFQDTGTHRSKKKNYAGAAAALFDEDYADGTDGTIAIGSGANGATSLSLLSTYRIQGLSSVEQLSLAAVFEIYDEIYGEGRSFSLKDADAYAQKFMLGYKVFVISSRCLPPYARPEGLHTIDCLWALRSKDKTQLVLECLPKLKTTWKEAAKLGMVSHFNRRELLELVLVYHRSGIVGNGL